ncbi:Cilia- And Flagella-Associated Protein 46 [Manis pentadactyla]|nr:Cilia- And Flagella-Associated Protein 46 [Manis pentadactyla]
MLQSLAWSSVVEPVLLLGIVLTLRGQVSSEYDPPKLFPEVLGMVSGAGRVESTYWNQGYGYQQGYGPGYGGSDYSPHGYYGYGPGYYYRQVGNLGEFQKLYPAQNARSENRALLASLTADVENLDGLHLFVKT